MVTTTATGVLLVLAVTQGCSATSDSSSTVAAGAAASGSAGSGSGGSGSAGSGSASSTSVVAAVASTIVVGAAKTEITVPADATPSASPAGTSRAATSPATTPSNPTGNPAAVPTTSTTPAAEVTTPTLPRTAQVGLPPAGAEPRNQLDQPIRLDESAALACARGEFALEALDAGDAALARNEVAEVARWGAPSANAAISRAAVELAATFSEAPSRSRVEAFLAVCTANGHVL